MSAQRYAKANQKLGRGEIDLESDDIRVIACKAGYARDLTNDEFVSDIGAGNISARSADMVSKVVSASGVFDADDTVIPAIPGGHVITQLVIYQHVGADSANSLIGNLDEAVNMPYTGTGADLTARWSNGANRIMKI